jgi:mRNA interferase MazF
VANAAIKTRLWVGLCFFVVRLITVVLITNKKNGVLIMNERKIRRGDIYYADLNPVIGSEQGNLRPVLVVQNNVGNEYSPTIVVVPITCNLRKNPLPTHVLIPQACGLEADSLALAEQIRTIDRMRFEEYIGRIEDDILPAIEKALEICVGLEKQRQPKGELINLTLCRRCESDFRNSGYLLVKKGWQKIKTKCDFCRNAKGLSFGVFGLDGR